MSKIYIYPNTSKIISDIALLLNNIVEIHYSKKRSILTIQKNNYEDNCLLNFAFSTTFKGVFSATNDMVEYAKNNNISCYIHIRSCVEFADKNYSIGIPEFRIYAILKYISFLYSKILCSVYGIQFNYITLPLVMTKNSHWEKLVPQSLETLRKYNNFFANLIRECELHVLDGVTFLGVLNNPIDYCGSCAYRVLTISQDAKKNNAHKLIFLFLKFFIKYTPANFLLSALVKVKILPLWAILFREAHYRDNF
jgi:hypothetical protein